MCLVSCLFGEDKEILFPKLDAKKDLLRFSDIALKFLEVNGLQAKIMKTEQEAREFFKKENSHDLWPCYFFESDTTGEKEAEEFFTNKETVDWQRFQSFELSI